MFPYNTSSYTTNQNQYPFAHLPEPSAPPTQLSHYWICAGCGTKHARILPEECKNCGATALEFEYSAPTTRVSRS